MTPEQLTAAAGIIIGIAGWVVNRRRAKNDAAASLIDDLAGQLTEARDTMTAANTNLRATLDYVYVLRRQLQENDLEPEQWPDHLIHR